MDWGLLGWVLTIAVPVMLGTWLGYSRLGRRNAALADVGFCVGFGVVAVSVGLTSGGEVSHRVVLAAMGATYAFHRIICAIRVGSTADSRTERLYILLTASSNRYHLIHTYQTVIYDVCDFISIQMSGIFFQHSLVLW